MAVSLFDSTFWSWYFGDVEFAALFTDEAELRAMLRVAAALARAQGAIGMLPRESAATIAHAAETMPIDPASFADGTEAYGLPIKSLVDALSAVVPEHADWVHLGATSQDIVDTALALRLAPMLEILNARLGSLVEELAEMALSHDKTVIAARTRTQIAVPTTLGARVAAWGMPLIRHRARLVALRSDVLVLTLRGAAGTRAALGLNAEQIARRMAADLGLSLPLLQPHSRRDGLAALAAWMALVTGTLGKMGQDLILLGQSEIGEVTEGAGGASSTMPHKQNPVAAEALVALARANAARAGKMLGAMIHAGERDGTAWTSEWVTLPRMVVATGAALRHARVQATGLTAHPERIAKTFSADSGLMMAEHAVGLLAAELGRTRAADAVVEACVTVSASGVTLAEALVARCPGIDWAAQLRPEMALGAAPKFARRFAEAARE